MDDLISRQALYEILDEYDEGKIYWGEAEDRIGNLPSVRTERKKGEWERKSFYDDTLICSECGIEGRWDFEYCPYCGARMDGES